MIVKDDNNCGIYELVESDPSDEEDDIPRKHFMWKRNQFFSLNIHPFTNNHFGLVDPQLKKKQ